MAHSLASAAAEQDRVIATRYVARRPDTAPTVAQVDSCESGASGVHWIRTKVRTPVAARWKVGALQGFGPNDVEGLKYKSIGLSTRVLAPLRAATP
jgi:hypothetical protein